MKDIFHFFKKSMAMDPQMGHRKAISLAFLSLKGGVGKTSLCVSVARLLAEKGFRVLCIDGDPQANASLSLSRISYSEIENQVSLYDLLYESLPASKAPRTVEPRLDLVFSNSGVALLNQITDSSTLKKFELILNFYRNQYDYVIFDTSPSSSVLHGMIMKNCDFLFSPICADSFSLQGLARMILDVQDIRNKFKTNVVHKIIPNTISIDDRDFVTELTRALPENAVLPPISVWTNFEPTLLMELAEDRHVIERELSPVIEILKTRQNDFVESGMNCVN